MSSPKATSSIGQKILLRSLVVALVPLVLLGLAVYFGVSSMRSNASQKVNESREILSEETIVVTSQRQADQVAKEINLILVERIEDVLGWARSPVIVGQARDAGSFSFTEGLQAQSIEELEVQFENTKSTGVSIDASQFLSSEIARATDFKEVFITDKYGYNAAMTNPTSDFVQSDEDWWQEAWSNGLSISDVEFDDSAQVFSIDISARIANGPSGNQGVMKASLDISFVESIVQDNASDDVDFIVSLNDGQLISGTEHQSDHMMNLDMMPEDHSVGLADALVTGAPGAQVDDEVVWAHTSTKNPDAFAGIEGFDGFDWIVVSTQSAESAFAPISGIEQLDDDISASGNRLLAITLGVLLLAALVAFVSARILAESIVTPIRRLTWAASDAATTGLPSAVAEINTEGADPDSIEAPQVEIRTNDELEELAGSFNLVQDSAIRLAAQQAVSRRNTSEMFVNLGRRNQSLLKRQLRFIDGLEKSETDPDTLESLFKLDHLATRMRRNAESLLVLAGDRTPRRWAKPAPIEQAMQAALAEVENYDRVNLFGLAEGQVQGNVVADVAHVLAELVENALNFSPPQSEVVVTGEKSDAGYTITITDEGMGMSKEDIAAANLGLEEVHELSDVPSRCLGLFVVGRLARRHDIEVRLASSPNGSGLQSIVTLPLAITDAAQDAVEVSESEEKDLSSDGSISDAEIEALARLAEAESALAIVQQAKLQSSSDASTKDDEASKDPDASTDEDVEAVRVTDESEDRPKIETEPASTPSSEFGRRVGDEIPAGAGGEKASRGEGSHEDSASDSDDDVVATTEAADSVNPNGDTPAEESADPAAVAEMTELGFARRSSKKVSGPKTISSMSQKKQQSSTGDVMQDAEQNRNRWSQFQRGKEDAEGEITES